MRAIPLLLAALLCACDSPPGTNQGAAELRKLAAAQQTVLTWDYDEGGGEGEVPASEFVADVNRPSAYAGSYHFGDSERESTLTITVQGEAVTGTLEYGGWENERWVTEVERLEGGTVEGARLSAPGWKGVFVRYRGKPGLVILRGPGPLDRAEFGGKLNP